MARLFCHVFETSQKHFFKTTLVSVFMKTCLLFQVMFTEPEDSAVEDPCNSEATNSLVIERASRCDPEFPPIPTSPFRLPETSSPRNPRQNADKSLFDSHGQFEGMCRSINVDPDSNKGTEIVASITIVYYSIAYCYNLEFFREPGKT